MIQDHDIKRKLARGMADLMAALKKDQDLPLVLSMTLESVWGIAHQSPGAGDWDYRWQRMSCRIDGIRLALIYFNPPAYAKLKDDLRMLYRIAIHHQGHNPLWEVWRR